QDRSSDGSFGVTLRAPVWRSLAVLAAVTTVVCLVLWSPGQSYAASFTVNSTTDAVDASPGDGLCATSGGQCTLRAAIEEANALPGADIVNLPAGTYSISLGAGDFNAASDLHITDELEIRGAGANQTFVDGGYYLRAIATFWIHPAVVSMA